MSCGRPRSRAYYNATQALYLLKEGAHDHRFNHARGQFKAKENTHDFTEYLRYESDYQPRVDDPDPGTTEILRYTQSLRTILEALPTVGVVPAPSEILPGVYLGTVSHAENIKLLNKMGISYILNCAGIPCIRPQRQERYSFRPDIDIRGYEELPAEDGVTYDITHHFPKAFRFIDASRRQGRVLIYCPDVNRSGAIAIGYLGKISRRPQNRSVAIAIGYLVSKGESSLEAARIVKDMRKRALFNRRFMKQLAVYARDRKQLERKVPYLGMQQRVRVKDRPKNSRILGIY